MPRPVQVSAGSIFGPINSISTHKELIWQLAYREILGKYKGSFLGLLWSLLNPLFLLAIYTFVFTQVFKSRWIEGGTTGDYAIALFVGLIAHGFLAECLSRAPGLIVGNPSYVKKVVFPLEILPFPIMLAALFHAFASIVILLIAKWLLTGGVPWTALAFPIVILPLSIQGVAFSWILSSLSVYVRDVSQTVALLVTALLFISPVFFPVKSLPQYLHVAARWNPLTIPIEESRKILIWGQWPDWSLLGIYTVASVLLAWLGFIIFQKSRKGFADVI